MYKPFYITTTLPYVNAPLHMGHALEFIRADSVARYKALQGYEVFFNTGTDEHGQKIYTKAKENDLEPQEFVDQNFKNFKKQISSFGIMTEVNFVRTTNPEHINASQQFWRLVDQNGYIYKKTYQAKYCIGCEEVKTDSDLVNGCCSLHPSLKIEYIDEENYFFKLSALEQKLKEFYQVHSNFVVPQFRYNELKAFLEKGLEDFSISRLKEKMSWGIPVPGDEEHVMYVWFDALINYISTLGWPKDTEKFEKFWLNGTPTQYCGKDNTRFQALIWQAMLLAANIAPSDKIVVNGFITGDGGIRMSKTLGNVVDPLEIAEMYGTDSLRMFLLKDISSFEDSPFTIERFKESYNANLSNGLGNLVSRVMTLSEKYCDQFVGLPDNSLSERIDKVMLEYDIQKAMQYIWEAIRSLDSQIQLEEPFKAVKIDLEVGRRMIYRNVCALYTIAESLAPFMPTTSEMIIDLIRQNKKPASPLFQRV